MNIVSATSRWYLTTMIQGDILEHEPIIAWDIYDNIVRPITINGPPRNLVWAIRRPDGVYDCVGKRCKTDEEVILSLKNLGRAVKERLSSRG